MNSRFRLWFRSPIFLLSLAAGLIAFAVQSGEVGTADTMHRLQSTHAFWTSEPPVFPNEYPEFGVHGRNGSLQSWYGIGQSLLMLPQDILGTYIGRLHVFDRYGDTDPTVRDIVVTYLTQMFVTVLTALVCFRLLRQFSFQREPLHRGGAGLSAGDDAPALHAEHDGEQLHLPADAGRDLVRIRVAADREAGARWLIGTGALGLNLLTRLTTGIDLLAGALFVLLVLWFEGCADARCGGAAEQYAVIAVPVFCFFGFLDRLYQFYRFGSFTNTYVSLVAKETIARDPSLPSNYPWTTPWHEGFFGALFAPEKSIFLFDPLIILALFLLVLHWRRTPPAVRAYAIATCLMLLAYLSFYARYFRLGRRLRMGRSLRFDCGRVGGADGDSSAAEVSARGGTGSLGHGHGAAGGERSDPD